MSWTLLDSGTAPLNAAGSGQTYTFPAGAANANDLLILAISSDTTVSTPAGWTSAVSAVANNAGYIFYRVASGGETSVTVTTSGSFPTAVGFLRYSGNTSAPLDVTASAVHSVSGSATPAVTTPALAQTGELSVAAGCLGGLQGSAQTGITWSSGYTGQINGTSGALTNMDQRILVGTNPTAGTAAESPNVSWTGATSEQTILVATFKPQSSWTGQATAAFTAGLSAAGTHAAAGGAQAAVNATITADASVTRKQGSWWQLLDIRRQARLEFEMDPNVKGPPLACPHDGEPLQPGPPSQPGIWWCPWGDYQYPRDWVRPEPPAGLFDGAAEGPGSYPAVT